MIKRARLSFIILAMLLLVVGFTDEANATGYRVSFNNSEISITSPQISPVRCDGILSVTGTTELDTVYFGLRGPNQELTSCKAEVIDGRFAIDIKLRYGNGVYTIWAGSNPQKFDGSIRFLAENASIHDNQDTAPSYYVDSSHPVVVKLAESLAPPGISDMDKLCNIHNWVVTNMSYDCDYQASGRSNMEQASRILEKRDGVCSHYAILTAALCRAVGLPARIVNGPARPSLDTPYRTHAWNEVLINGQWVSVDTCWDSGYVKDNTFVSSPSSTFLAPPPAVFATTHTRSNITQD
ncbi:MAG: transglutaminase domain-containing protein [Bacillota bacterium]